MFTAYGVAACWSRLAQANQETTMAFFIVIGMAIVGILLNSSMSKAKSININPWNLQGFLYFELDVGLQIKTALPEEVNFPVK